MDSVHASQIEELRAWALAEIERSDIGGQKLWTEAWTFLKYILYLPVDDLRFIAAHTSFFGGYSPMAYWNRLDRAEDSIEVKSYKQFTEDLPDEWHISEPEMPGLPSQKGFRSGDKIINGDTIRYQLFIANMYFSGTVDHLLRTANPIICEVGGGSGALALQLGTRLKNVCYVLIDLPETLFTAGVYIHLNSPDARLYRCTAHDTAETVEAAARAYDYILVPSIHYQAIKKLQVTLFLNMLSFQEMPEHVIDRYVRFFANFDATLLSDNWSKHPLNTQLNCRVEDILAKYYTLVPHLNFYEANEIVAPLFAEVYGRTKLFFGMPKGKDWPFPLGTFKIVRKDETLLFPVRP